MNWYYDKWVEAVKQQLVDLEIENIAPSVWNKRHVQVVYIDKGKRFCIQIPEEKLCVT